ncbi:uncharacterized protein JCM15063_004551 [Sporobolomyces koalae]|uniref:uncharacterized protein n=1 Tax=Sporobolomyces koalae TaxID=500713 RepID=UPI003176BDC9
MHPSAFQLSSSHAAGDVPQETWTSETQTVSFNNSQYPEFLAQVPSGASDQISTVQTITSHRYSLRERRRSSASTASTASSGAVLTPDTSWDSPRSFRLSSRRDRRLSVAPHNLDAHMQHLEQARQDPAESSTLSLDHRLGSLELQDWLNTGPTIEEQLPSEEDQEAIRDEEMFGATETDPAAAVLDSDLSLAALAALSQTGLSVVDSRIMKNRAHLLYRAVRRVSLVFKAQSTSIDVTTDEHYHDTGSLALDALAPTSDDRYDAASPQAVSFSALIDTNQLG